MGIEIPKKYGGCEFSFTSSIIAVEGKHKIRWCTHLILILWNYNIIELAKVDPSVSIICDIHVRKKKIMHW